MANIKEKLYKIKDDIIKGIDEYFGYSHFSSRNMADYTLMNDTATDMVNVYDISEHEAIEIIEYLTH